MPNGNRMYHLNHRLLCRWVCAAGFDRSVEATDSDGDNTTTTATGSVNAVLNTDDIIAANKSPVSATDAEMRCLPSEAYNISDMPRDDHSVSDMPRDGHIIISDMPRDDDRSDDGLLDSLQH